MSETARNSAFILLYWGFRQSDDSLLCDAWVIPFEAFGWGYSVLQQTGYQWPKTIINEEITNRKQLKSLLLKAEKAGCDGVWYAEDEQVIRIR